MCAVRYADGRNAAPSAISISEVMSSDPLYSAGPDDPISSVKDLMRNQQIRRLPVLDHERKLVGIVSLGDLATRQSGHVDRAVREISEPSEPDAGPASS